MSPCPPHPVHEWLRAEASGRQAAAEHAFGAALGALPEVEPPAGFGAAVMTRVAAQQPSWARSMPVLPRVSEPLLGRTWVRSALLLVLLWAAALARLLPAASLVAGPIWRPAVGVRLLAGVWIGVASALRDVADALALGQVTAAALRSAAGTAPIMLLVALTLALGALALMALRFLLEPQSIDEKSRP